MELFIPSMQLIVQEDGFSYHSESPSITKKMLEITDKYFEGSRRKLHIPKRETLKFLLSLAQKNSMEVINIRPDCIVLDQLFSSSLRRT